MNVVNNPVHRISLIISNFEGVIEHDVQYLPSDSGKYFVTENGWNIVEAQMAQISTNDSTVSGWIWTNESAPLWRKP